MHSLIPVFSLLSVAPFLAESLLGGVLVGRSQDEGRLGAVAAQESSGVGRHGVCPTMVGMKESV
ncbi:hypothetical protein [Dactylosporangium sp. NPDC051541]|uniref:hypothetical protein n=1 Tax=Dactylosporangium sp. NPDC051541 TaxID=3363977 RepID=UPI00379A94C1